uniref:Uncharacterized protein n=1 Tax=Fagus sylvatica TaxID=28930 RepID=A0A2N9H3H9_FAGSY
MAKILTWIGPRPPWPRSLFLHRNYAPPVPPAPPPTSTTALSLSRLFSSLSPSRVLFSLLSLKFPKTTMAKPGSSPAPLITTADGGGFWLGLASLSSRGYW